MSSQYSAMARSDENLPLRAVFRMDIFVQESLSCLGGAHLLLAVHVGRIVGAHQEGVVITEVVHQRLEDLGVAVREVPPAIRSSTVLSSSLASTQRTDVPGGGRPSVWQASYRAPRSEWAPARFNVTTPAMIRPTPTTLATDIEEPRNSTAISTIAAVPIADHNA